MRKKKASVSLILYNEIKIIKRNRFNLNTRDYI